MSTPTAESVRITLPIGFSARKMKFSKLFGLESGEIRVIRTDSAVGGDPWGGTEARWGGIRA